MDVDRQVIVEENKKIRMILTITQHKLGAICFKLHYTLAACKIG